MNKILIIVIAVAYILLGMFIAYGVYRFKKKKLALENRTITFNVRFWLIIISIVLFYPLQLLKIKVDEYFDSIF